MSVTKFPVNNYENYHAHVYFEQDTLCFAADSVSYTHLTLPTICSV